MKALLAMLLISSVALAQGALDPTMSGAYPKYPAYLDHSCGGVTQTNLGETVNDDGTVTGSFRFSTTCSTGGRGTKPMVYVACWRVTFAADHYFVLAQENTLTTHYRYGQPAMACPAL